MRRRARTLPRKLQSRCRAKQKAIKTYLKSKGDRRGKCLYGLFRILLLQIGTFLKQKTAPDCKNLSQETCGCCTGRDEKTGRLWYAVILKLFNLINIGERSGSGIPSIFSVWRKEGYDEPEIIEMFEPERIKLQLKFTKIGDKNRQ